jgi:hypothetical protein
MKTLPLKLTAVALAALMLVGCTPNQILVTLEASVAAAEVLVATLPNIPPEVRAQVTAALVELPDAFQETSSELATTDAAGVKFAKITVFYAGTLLKLKALPAAAQPYVSAIVNAINSFLRALAPPATALRASPTSPALRVGTYKNLSDRIVTLTERIALNQKR